jgi:hypothetical protein
MKSENDFYVGQILYIDRGAKIEEVTISSIRRKYLYLDGYYDRYPIDKQTLTYKNKNYTNDSFILVKDKQEILDKNEKSNLLSLLRVCFDWSGKAKDLSLQDLRKIAEILKIE